MERRATSRRPLIVVVFALLCAAVATPCSWDDSPIIFFDVRPDAPIDRYVDGNLGILQPSYARSHLVIAYRYLSGKPPSAVERQGFGELLRHRLAEDPEAPVSGAEQWGRLVATLRGVEYKGAPEMSRSVGGGEQYEWFLNCTDDAFQTAAVTLADRVKTFGAAHPAVKAWLDAQEIVFANCGGSDAKVAEAEAALPAVIRADRQYQIASADFYAMRYGDARQRYLSIAADRQSPWRHAARLVAARSLIRAENFAIVTDVENPLDLAWDELDAILADKSMASYHDSAWRLRAIITVRSNPQVRFDEATRALMNGEPSAQQARTDLADYTILWDKEQTNDAELTDWIRTFQSGALPHALERWQATKGTHWLVAALAHVKAEDPAVKELLATSKSIKPDSPAFATVVHHRARLLTDRDAVRTELDRVLAQKDLPQSARNQLLARRRGLARSLSDFLRDTPVTIVGRGSETVETPEVLLPEDAAVVFNYWMPLEMLQEAAGHESLPEGIRTALRNAAETRAALLKRGEDFDLVTEIARTPSSSPYVMPLDGADYGNHWWCQYGLHDTELAKSLPVPPFLDRDDAANEEFDRLAARGSGATWILRHAIARAKSHPDDPRVPEVLSRAILGTRRACGDDDTDKLAEQAFGILHRKYGKTKWAEETPYWYRSGW
jgi:hypothetical protein